MDDQAGREKGMRCGGGRVASVIKAIFGVALLALIVGALYVWAIHFLGPSSWHWLTEAQERQLNIWLFGSSGVVSLAAIWKIVKK